MRGTIRDVTFSLASITTLFCFWSPSHGQKISADSFKMYYSVSFVENGELRLAAISRCAAAGKLMRCLMTLEPDSPKDRHVDTEFIVTEEYIYFRGSDNRWDVVSDKTLEAVNSTLPGYNPSENLRTAKELADKNNMQLIRTTSFAGRKVEVWRTPKLVKSDYDLLWKSEMWISPADNRIRKFQVDTFGAITMELEARTNWIIYAYNKPVKIRVPEPSELR